MLSEEEKKAIKYFYNLRSTIDESYMLFDEEINVKCEKEMIKQITLVLKLVKKQQEQLELIKEYAHQEIVHYTETIKDYIDDDKEENKDYIGELKELREHWKDIEKILQNKPKEELYMNWWRYGLYE